MAADIVPGTNLGKYRIVRKIGTGGMGDVFEATHLELRRRVAIKMLRTTDDDPAARGRFLREGRAAARIHHPQVVTVHDVGEWNGIPYLVMEFLQGGDLAGALRTGRIRSVEDVLDTMLPVIAAIGAAHGAGVIHRDLKPSNIFLARLADGTTVPKVVDFGISTLGAEHATRTGEVLGTPAYMSPEQVRGMRDLPPASDQYALGAILFECLAGRTPVEGGPAFGMLLRIAQGERLHLGDVRPDLPPALVAAVERALATAGRDRFPDVRTLGHALIPFASTRSRALWAPGFDPDVTTAMAAPADDHPEALADDAAVIPPRRSRHSLHLAAGVATAAAVLGGIALAGIRNTAPREYEVEYSAMPATARIALDGVALGTNRLHRTFSRDGVTHVLLVTAPGFSSEEIQFANGAPASRFVTLHPVGGAAVAPSPHPGTAGAPALVTQGEPSPVSVRGHHHAHATIAAVAGSASAEPGNTVGVPAAATTPDPSPAAHQRPPPLAAPAVEPAPERAPDRHSSMPGVVVPPAARGVVSPFGTP